MSATLVLLPGLGADERLFQAQRSRFPDLLVPSWPEPRVDDSLQEFAARLADVIPEVSELYLGGASFGGMVALELAPLLRPKAVVLIGSCRSPTAIARLARRTGRIAGALPVSAFQPRRWAASFMIRKFGRLNGEQRELFWEMAEATPARFLKWGVNAILSWRPSRVSTPVRHIHGRDDELIPVHSVSPDCIVDGAGHLLSLTHPNEVNAFLTATVGHG